MIPGTNIGVFGDGQFNVVLAGDYGPIANFETHPNGTLIHEDLRI